MVEIDFNDLTFLDNIKKIDLEYPDKIDWPEEGYFVGITNSNWARNNDYTCEHFYKPDFNNSSEKYSWGGYHTYDEDTDEYTHYWTMNYNYGVKSEYKRYIWQVPDRETGEKLAALLNYIPNPNVFDLNDEINTLNIEIAKIEAKKENIYKVLNYENNHL